MLKKDFPIFENNPTLVYLDSTASTQKPKYVIEAISSYLSNSYSNIHRGMYDIAVDSEKMYFDSKKKIAGIIGSKDFREIIYTYNSTYALNLLTQTLRYNKFLKAGDKVLLSITEHHANIVPWLILKNEIGIEIDFVNIDDNYKINFDDFSKKLTPNVKVVSFTQVSNVTGSIFDLEKIGKMIKTFSKDILFVIDVSQSVPHFKIDVEKLKADFVFFTGHKIMADSGIGVLWGKKELLEILNPVFSGGGAINSVEKNCFTNGSLPFKFEPGTPNITGALSLLKAIEYIENIGGFEEIEKIENKLIKYILEKIEKYPEIKLIGSKKNENRVGVFSFVIDGIQPTDVADIMADKNICIRSGQHCAEPFMAYIGETFVCRMSLYIYNDKSDIDKFFEVIDEILEK